VVVRGLRARWTSFVGSFVAVALGVGITAALGFALDAAGRGPERQPARFAAAAALVRGVDEVTADGHRRALDRPRPLPASLVRKLGQAGAVADRSFAVTVGGEAAAGHPWSTAPFARYTLSAGRAPRSAAEAVVSGIPADLGRQLTTSRGPVTVVGVARTPKPFERALFVTDERARQLAPDVRQMAIGADPAAARALVRDHPGVRVLTGPDRVVADAAPARDRAAVTALTALFGTAAGVAGFVAVFVVASTFAYAVVRRRREFGLLRTVGVTAGQLRRAVVTEALLVGAAASAAGCVLGGRAAPALGRWTVGQGLAPAWFTVRTGQASWPYHLAFWTGLAVALAGAAAASWRAGRTGPLEVLRDAAADGRVMTWPRRVGAAALLLTAAVTLAAALAGDPGELLHRKTYITRPMLLIAAAALAAPVLLRPALRLLTWLPVRRPRATGRLVRAGALGGLRRTAAVAAPVLATVALAGSLLGATGTVAGAKAAEARARTVADLVVTPGDADGFDAATTDRLRRVPGATVSPSAATTLYVPEDGGVALVATAARAAEPGPLARTVRPPVAAGRIAALDDRSVIVTEEWQQHRVGDRVTLWRGDGTRVTLRIAAVLRTGTGDNGAYVTPRNAAGAPVDRVDVTLAPGASRAAVTAGLRDAVAGTGARVATRAEWLAGTAPGTSRTTRLGLLLVLGIALLYTGIAVASTTVAATAERVRDLAVLRLAGATRGQALRVLAWEALAVTVAAGLLGVLVTAANLLGMSLALARLGVTAPPDIPWTALGGTLAACAAVAVVSAVAAARCGPALRGGTNGWRAQVT
jgi:putative ABC transport system permease protein